MIGVVLLIIAAVQNNQSIDLRFLIWQARIDGLLLFLILFAVGFLVGVLFARRGRGKEED
jgi:uncharacterized integral membrane protein